MGTATKFETFFDGLCSFWVLDDNRQPVPVLENVRFQQRVIGAKRNYLAEQAGHTVERLIRIPRRDDVARGTFVVIGKEQYKVIQSQMIPDTCPQCTDLTLEQADMLLDFDQNAAGQSGRY